MTVYCTVCAFCEHYLDGFKCKAFPEGIPNIMLDGRPHHDEVRVDQVGEYVFDWPEGALEKGICLTWRVCEECKHYLGDNKCRAYPGGMPLEMYDSLHREIWPDQVGEYTFVRRREESD